MKDRCFISVFIGAFQPAPWLKFFSILVIPFCVYGCSGKQNVYYNPSKAHHQTDGFTNSDGSKNNKTFWDLLHWKLNRTVKQLPLESAGVYPKHSDFPTIPFSPRSKDLPQKTSKIHWLGHSSVLLETNDFKLLTDPHFSERASPFNWFGPKRKTPAPVSVEQLPQIDVVVISHNHYDHLDETTVRQLIQTQPNIVYLVPLGVEGLLRQWGALNVHALDWWDTFHIGQTELIFVPAHHWSGRFIRDRNTTLWGGWVLHHPNIRFYFSGDTGYSKDFINIGNRYGPFDVSAIAVGAYEPRWFMKEHHVNPDEALKIHQDVKSKWSIRIHWGTFELTDEALDQPIMDLNHAKKSIDIQNFDLLKHGEGRFIESSQSR